MAVVTRRMPVPAAAVFAVLSDGFSYADWVVGTRAIRGVEGAFPAVGSKLHYTVGWGPLRKDDETEVVSCKPGRWLELRAKAWPVGTARIALELVPVGSSTEVSIEEHIAEGPALLLHNPLTDASIWARNQVTLRRLERIARRRHARLGS